MTDIIRSVLTLFAYALVVAVVLTSVSIIAAIALAAYDDWRDKRGRNR